MNRYENDCKSRAKEEDKKIQNSEVERSKKMKEGIPPPKNAAESQQISKGTKFF